MRAGRPVLPIVALALIVTGVATATSTVVVSGVVLRADENQKKSDQDKKLLPVTDPRSVGLYAFPKKGDDDIVSGLTWRGTFTLTAPNHALEGETAYVIDEQGAGRPARVKIHPPKDGVREGEKVELILLSCDVKNDVVDPGEVQNCVVANGETHAIKQRAKKETPQQADAAFRGQVSELLMNVPGWTEKDVGAAMGELRRPFGDPTFPALASVAGGRLLDDARRIVATRERHCSSKIQPASTAAYAAFGDRCEGDTVVLTAGGVHLVSVTQGRVVLDDRANTVTLAWPRDSGRVCLTAQPVSTDEHVAGRPRWRMTKQAEPGETEFVWNAVRARQQGVLLSSLGFLAQRCELKGDPVLVPLRVNGASGSPAAPFRVVIRSTGEVHRVTATITDVRDGGTTEAITPTIGEVAPRDPHPHVWVEIPAPTKGPGVLKVSVRLESTSSFDEPLTVPFSLRHD